MIFTVSRMRALLSCHHLRSWAQEKGLVVLYMMDPMDENAVRAKNSESRVRTIGQVDEESS